MKTSSILECSSLQDHFDRIDLVAHFPKHQPSAQRKARFFPRNDSHRSSSIKLTSAQRSYLGNWAPEMMRKAGLGLKPVTGSMLNLLSFRFCHFRVNISPLTDRFGRVLSLLVPRCLPNVRLLWCRRGLVVTAVFTGLQSQADFFALWLQLIHLMLGLKGCCSYRIMSSVMFVRWGVIALSGH